MCRAPKFRLVVEADKDRICAARKDVLAGKLLIHRPHLEKEGEKHSFSLILLTNSSMKTKASVVLGLREKAAPFAY